MSNIYSGSFYLSRVERKILGSVSWSPEIPSFEVRAMGGRARREKTRRAGSAGRQALNGVLPGCHGVRGRFVHRIDNRLAVDESPVRSENDQIAMAPDQNRPREISRVGSQTGYPTVAAEPENVRREAEHAGLFRRRTRDH